MSTDGFDGNRTMACAKAFGARRIIAVDVNEERLAFARNFIGAETHFSMSMESGEERGVYAQRHVSVIPSSSNSSE